MNDNQELDEIIQEFALAEQQLADDFSIEAITEEDFDVRDTIARETAKAAIQAYVARQCREAVDEKLTELSKLKLSEVVDLLGRQYHTVAKRKSRLAALEQEEDI